MLFLQAETWKLLSDLNQKSMHDLPVVFEDVQIFSEINFSSEGKTADEFIFWRPAGKASNAEMCINCKFTPEILQIGA